MIATFPHSDKADAARHYARLQSLSDTHTILPGHGEIHLPAASSLGLIKHLSTERTIYPDHKL